MDISASLLKLPLFLIRHLQARGLSAILCPTLDRKNLQRQQGMTEAKIRDLIDEEDRKWIVKRSHEE